MAVVRFQVAAEDAGTFLPRATRALDALAACAGFEGGSLGPATDDPQLWVMVTRWASVGQYRRGLSSYDVKLRAHPLLYQAVDEPSAFEELVAVAGDGTVHTATTDRADDSGAPHSADVK